ncbi:MAG TPA: hypothetical protein VFC71_07690 [Candidatus Polarisedimenticolia bacterium]|nr:hypothetical protein [Candidatus Polarisedimenticolia bacterium]
MRFVLAFLICVLLVACSSRSEPDGQLIDGIWVGDPISCDEVGASGSPSCERIIECGARNEFGGKTPDLRDVAIHGLPTRMKDGTLITYGMGGWIVVFTLSTGEQRATYVIETDAGRCEGPDPSS